MWQIVAVTIVANVATAAYVVSLLHDLAEQQRQIRRWLTGLAQMVGEVNRR